ncbi:TPA: DMT family transporter [Salmonella enterica subsp. diarizonae serovar 61:l,v:z35]|uniref:DMT family transporter n=1 Tax=Citrobacter werkmanii TaxID=67827 RepID=UPI0012BDE416|nr:DMT family transporter [Salmonella enterica subsp. enterica serovar Newport]
MRHVIYIVFAFLAGVALPVQGSANAELSRVLDNPVTASLVSGLVGIVFMGLVIFIFHAPLPNSAVISAPWWAWLGGVMGVAFLIIGTLSIPVIGAANFFVVVITGQVIAALIIDKLGLLNVPVHTISSFRVLGVFLVIVGAIIMNLKI